MSVLRSRESSSPAKKIYLGCTKLNKARREDGLYWSGKQQRTSFLPSTVFRSFSLFSSGDEKGRDFFQLFSLWALANCSIFLGQYTFSLLEKVEKTNLLLFSARPAGQFTFESFLCLTFFPGCLENCLFSVSLSFFKWPRWMRGWGITFFPRSLMSRANKPKRSLAPFSLVREEFPFSRQLFFSLSQQNLSKTEGKKSCTEDGPTQFFATKKSLCEVLRAKFWKESCLLLLLQKGCYFPLLGSFFLGRLGSAEKQVFELILKTARTAVQAAPVSFLSLLALWVLLQYLKWHKKRTTQIFPKTCHFWGESNFWRGSLLYEILFQAATAFWQQSLFDPSWRNFLFQKASIFSQIPQRKEERKSLNSQRAEIFFSRPKWPFLGGRKKVLRRKSRCIKRRKMYFDKIELSFIVHTKLKLPPQLWPNFIPEKR